MTTDNNEENNVEIENKGIDITDSEEWEDTKEESNESKTVDGYISFILPFTENDLFDNIIDTVEHIGKQVDVVKYEVVIPVSSKIESTIITKLRKMAKNSNGLIKVVKTNFQFRNDLRNEGVKKATGKYVWIINSTFKFVNEKMLSQLTNLVVANGYDCLAMSFMLTNGKVTWKYYNAPLKTMADTKTINYESCCKIIRKEIFVDFPSKDYDSCDLYWWLKQMDKMSSAAVCESYIFSVSEDPELSRMKEFLKNNLLTFDQCVLTGILDVVKVKNSMIWEFVNDAVDLMSLKGSFKQAFAQNTWFDKIRIVMGNLESGKFSF